MRDGFYRQTARVEAAHWWFVHRRRLVGALLGAPAAGARALDVGCGSGGNLAWLRRAGWRAVGVDRSPLALELARAGIPDAALVRARAEDVEGLFRPASFGLVTVFNVLYHAWVPSETAVLAAARRVLAPGGLLVLTEPAFGFLRRRHDDVDCGVRRYTRRSLARLVEEAGFEVVRSTYFNVVAFAPALLVAALDRLGRGSARRASDERTAEIALPPRPLNRALLASCWIERKWIARVGRVPVGVGVLVLARAGRGGDAQVGT